MIGGISVTLDGLRILSRHYNGDVSNTNIGVVKVFQINTKKCIAIKGSEEKNGNGWSATGVGVMDGGDERRSEKYYAFLKGDDAKETKETNTCTDSVASSTSPRSSK